MNKLATKAVLGLTLAASALTVAAPAEAQRYRRYHRGGDATGAAVVAGVAGLAIGAALASDRRYDYDRRYYRQRGYYPRDCYYYRQQYRRYNGYNDCYVRRVWDPYLGRRVAVRYCD